MKTGKWTVSMRQPDGTLRVLANGVDITASCSLDTATGIIRLPQNVPRAEIEFSVPFGFRLETKRDRKLTLNAMTFNVWHALYGPGRVPPHPTSPGPNWR